MNGHVSVRDGDLAYVNAHSASRLSLRPEEVAVVREDSARRLWHAYAIGEPRRFSQAEIETVRAQTSSPRVIRKWWIDALERAKLAGVLDDIDPATLV